MNAFFLHIDHCVNAQFHVNRHVVKMPIESAQCLSTAHWETGGQGPYKSTHKNHPTCVWVRKSISNYLWMIDYGLSLCYEYTFRYGKVHATEEKLYWLSENIPNIPDLGMTEFYQAMPEELRCSNPIEAYRRYYNKCKTHLFDWKNRPIPEWIERHKND